jgi:GT2 family glycosyltransferase
MNSSGLSGRSRKPRLQEPGNPNGDPRETFLNSVTVVIPHWNGENILHRCLLALRKTQDVRFDVLLVDNASTDGSCKMVRSEFPEVRIVHSPVNLGYAAGCNLGIRRSVASYVALLNNDTEVAPNWLLPLVEALENDSELAAVQPKILSIQNPRKFDYCGAAGGEMDVFGYPFARGRIFDAIEIDRGQYDDVHDIFWATGAATVLRRSALDRIGLLDESFFAHMEEIDLNWRMHWAGFRIALIPSAVVFHQTGGTLSDARFRKMFLNHRNNLIMLIKNLSDTALFWILPLRLIMECLTCLGALVLGQPKRAAAVPAMFLSVLRRLPFLLRERKRASSVRKIPEDILHHRMYRGSIVLDYFVRGIREYGRLGIGVREA